MIGVLREGPLHRELKALLAAPGDRFEVRVDGYVIDLVRADGELVEIQTGGFTPLGPKLDALLDGHRMRIVHPVPAERRILRVDEHGEVLNRVQVVALGDGEAEIIKVAVPGDPDVSQGEMVRVEGMTAQAWEMDGRNGMAFRASAIRSISAREKAAA